MNEAMAVGFWFTTGAVAALGLLEFAKSDPTPLSATQQREHRVARERHGLPPVKYPPRRPGMFDLPLDGGRYL